MLDLIISKVFVEWRTLKTKLTDGKHVRDVAMSKAKKGLIPRLYTELLQISKKRKQNMRENEQRI